MSVAAMTDVPGQGLVGQLDRANVVGLEIDRLDMAATLARCEEFISQRRFAQHVAINAAKVIAAMNDPALRDIIAGCEIVSADGQSIVWASRILGDALPTRVAGIDLMQELLALAELRGYRVFILGAKPDVLARACEKLLARHPKLVLAGARDGYFDESENDEVVREVARARPDILFVAISSPRKEYWIGRYGRMTGVPFVMGVGGSVDVIAGTTRRAPLAWQRLGLEWLYRVLQEPRRLMWRYASTNLRFIWLVARAAILGRLGLRRPTEEIA